MKIPVAILVLASVLAIPAAADAAASVSEGRWQGYRSITLENSRLRITILPDASGRIAEYVYKPLGRNFFLPYKERNAGNPLLSSAGTVEHNFGGWEELIWENGLQKSRLKYTATVRNEPGRACVELTRPGAQKGLMISRTMTLPENSLSLRIDERLKNETAEGYSLWVHSMTTVDGDFNYDDNCIVPLRCSPEPVKLSANNSTFPVPEEVLLTRRPANFTSPMYLLGQPWFALSDAKGGFSVGQVLRPAELVSERMVYFAWSGEIWGVPAMSQELIFPQVKPGEDRTFTIYISALPGMERVSYMNTDAAFSVKPFPAGKRLQITILALRNIDGASLRVNFTGKQVVIPVKNLGCGRNLMKDVPAAYGLPVSAEWACGTNVERFKLLKEEIQK